MRPLAILVLLGALWIPSIAAAQKSAPAQAREQLRRDHWLELRRQAFATARQLLICKGVPFDPDELLRPNWQRTLKDALDSMPEMTQVRYEKGRLRGVYLADTLYLPQRIALVDDTVIVARHVVFEGNGVIIKSNHAFYFYTVDGDSIMSTRNYEFRFQSVNGRWFLGTSLSKAMQEAGFEARKDAALPSFDMLRPKVALFRDGEFRINVNGSTPRLNLEIPEQAKASYSENRISDCWNDMCLPSFGSDIDRSAAPPLTLKPVPPKPKPCPVVKPEKNKEQSHFR